MAKLLRHYSPCIKSIRLTYCNTTCPILNQSMTRIITKTANVLQHYFPRIKSIHDPHYNKTENVLQQYSPRNKSIHNPHYNKILFVLYQHNYHSIIMLIRYYSMTSCLQLQYMQSIIIIQLLGIIVIHLVYNSIHLSYYDTTHDGIVLVHSVD